MLEICPPAQFVNKNNKEALDYLSKRSLSKNTIQGFKLGFVPWKNNFYEELLKSGYELVPPELVLVARLNYSEQKTGEWLRFATPMKSMVDTDNVPHLPKFGKALGQYFIETYWSYPGAIFHPHNEFIVMKNGV